MFRGRGNGHDEYEVEIKDGAAVLTAKTDRGAIRQARQFTRENRTDVYLRVTRHGDGCSAYLDVNGNASDIGTYIR